MALPTIAKVLMLLSVFAFMSCASAQVTAPIFRDVTNGSGIVQVPAPKFGGPYIADIDDDGIYDLVLTFHANQPVQVYFGTRSGRFQPTDFSVDSDVHGIGVGQISTNTRDRLVVVSLGGGRGLRLRPPRIFRCSTRRELVEVTNQLGFGEAAGRGRVVLFGDLSMRSPNDRIARGGGPDLLGINFLGSSDPELKNFAYENVGNRYRLRRIGDFAAEFEIRGEFADINGDRVLELISFRDFKIYSQTGPFRLRDTTSQFLERIPIPARGRSISAVAEFDYDNDGDMDLYVARTDNTLISMLSRLENDVFSDFLLENRGGRYVDRSVRAGIPRGTFTMGVTTGDFNNNGHTDVMLSIWDSPDILLLNNGDRTFTRMGAQRMFPRLQTERGNHATAVDYDEDGSVDIILGRGSERDFLGTYRVMKNMLPPSADRNYLHVRVKNAPDGSATSLHALVTVLAGGNTLTKRVGSPGTQGGGASYLDTLHFGLGSATIAEEVRVTWTTGISRRSVDIPANRRVTIGITAES